MTEPSLNFGNFIYQRADTISEVVARRSQNPILKGLGYYNRDKSKKFAAIITIAAVALAAIAIGLAVHYVGADKMLHWFQGDFTSWFKHNFVTWITNHAQSLNISAAAVGGVALGVLLYNLAPSIKEKALRAFEALKASMPKRAENISQREIENQVENHQNVEKEENESVVDSENTFGGLPSSSESDPEHN